MDADLTKTFRPKKIEQLLGKDQITVARSLLESISNGNPFQKVMLLGPSGVGKTTIAKMYIRYLLELNGNEEVEDYITEINCSSETGIDSIRQVIDEMGKWSLLGDWRIYFLDELHGLTKNAQNALLTPIENLPDHTIVIVSTTETGKIIPTLRSRFKEYELKVPTREDFLKLAGWFSTKFGKTLDKKIIEEAIDRSKGNLRTYTNLLQDILNDKYVSSSEELDEKSLVYLLLFSNSNLSQLFEVAEKEVSFSGTAVGLCRYCISVIRNGRSNQTATTKAILLLKLFGQGLSQTQDEKSSFFGKLAEYWVELHSK